MIPYVATIIAFLASTVVAVDRLRRGSLRASAVSVAVVGALYVAMVAQRTMTEVTGTVSVLCVDIALLAVGMTGAMRLLSAFDPPPADGDDGPDGGDYGPLPLEPPGGRRTAWEEFDALRIRWEAEAQRRDRAEHPNDE